MDNRTIRLAVMKRCPEIYFISPPSKANGKIYWLMFAKIKGINRPVELHCDMPDTALISHRELLTTMVSEIYDEIKHLRTGKKALKDNPDEKFKPLSDEGQKIFDSPEIQYYSVGAPNIDPKKSSIIMP
jgi:hypothetical protein